MPAPADLLFRQPATKSDGRRNGNVCCLPVQRPTGRNNVLDSAAGQFVDAVNACCCCAVAGGGDGDRPTDDGGES